MQNSAEINLDVNAKNKFEGMTAFHLACLNNNIGTISVMLEKANSYKFDFEVKDFVGRTGYHLAMANNLTGIVSLICKMTGKQPLINIPFTDEVT